MNGEKCGFGLTVPKFFGHKLSSDGVSPSEEKIVAIIDARLPVTISHASVGISYSCYKLFLSLRLVHPKRNCVLITFVLGERNECGVKRLENNVMTLQCRATPRML